MSQPASPAVHDGQRTKKPWFSVPLTSTQPKTPSRKSSVSSLSSLSDSIRDIMGPPSAPPSPPPRSPERSRVAPLPLQPLRAHPVPAPVAMTRSRSASSLKSITTLDVVLESDEEQPPPVPALNVVDKAKKSVPVAVPSSSMLLPVMLPPAMLRPASPSSVYSEPSNEKSADAVRAEEKPTPALRTFVSDMFLVETVNPFPHEVADEKVPKEKDGDPEFQTFITPPTPMEPAPQEPGEAHLLAPRAPSAAPSESNYSTRSSSSGYRKDMGIDWLTGRSAHTITRAEGGPSMEYLGRDPPRVWGMRRSTFVLWMFAIFMFALAIALAIGLSVGLTRSG